MEISGLGRFDVRQNRLNTKLALLRKWINQWGASAMGYPPESTQHQRLLEKIKKGEEDIELLITKVRNHEAED